jgi:hypothetical protein
MLNTALNDLKRSWDRAGEDWRDQAREEFGVEVLDEILPTGRAAVRAMSEITQLLKRVVRECS